MGGLNIRLRIWLSVGIFLFGYLLSTLADQVTRRINENDFRMVSDVLVPAAQSGHDSTNAFNQVVESYQENFLAPNPAGLERASKQAERVIEDLAAIAQSRDVPPA